jgi:DNA-binding response OmpR family regulator
MYRLKLELDGYHVTVVAGDDRVLEESARTRPDMIYIDLRLGDEARFATLQELRATAGTRNLPVIILSDLGVSELRERGFDAGPLDYVVRAAPNPNGLTWTAQQWARAGTA